MHAGRLFVVTALFLSLGACKQHADAPAQASSEAVVDGADAGAMGNAASQSPEAAAEARARTEGGAFAREPGFQLPTPVSNAPVQTINPSISRQIDVAAVTSAVVAGLEGTGSNVQVRVNPGGIVALSGEVATLALLQHAQYLARAQPGVVEVDYRNLRVRQR